MSDTQSKFYNDADVLSDLRAGKANAFRQMVETHGPRMRVVASRIVGETDANDCLQDAFLHAFQKIDSFKDNAMLATWLHRIVVNTALMRRRKSHRHAEVSLESLMPVFDETGCRVEPKFAQLDQPDLAERAEVRTAVLDAVGKLPENARRIIILRDVQGLDTEETARELEISISATKVRLHRARAALKKLLEPVFGASDRLDMEKSYGDD